MKLHTQEWGTGPRTAALIHGIMSDHRTWHRVGPALAAQGYRVIAVDLRGHGASPRGPYSAESWADDLTETLPPGLDLALGHSLGAMALALAVERLTPARAVYADPAWALHHGRTVDAAVLLTRGTYQKQRTRSPRPERERKKREKRERERKETRKKPCGVGGAHHVSWRGAPWKPGSTTTAWT
ncbi:alpha/beta fold hydrolase [Streptomyces sp. ST1020]|uniref:alpha/beta fold hydrolase n=1 Tax=Streptomyces sp. ST1020 TaxID=1848901 RepID=UPI0034C64AD9